MTTRQDTAHKPINATVRSKFSDNIKKYTDGAFYSVHAFKPRRFMARCFRIHWFRTPWRGEVGPKDRVRGVVVPAPPTGTTWSGSQCLQRRARATRMWCRWPRNSSDSARQWCAQTAALREGLRAESLQNLLWDHAARKSGLYSRSLPRRLSCNQSGSAFVFCVCQVCQKRVREIVGAADLRDICDRLRVVVKAGEIQAGAVRR